jgi:hypothetical protein
MPSEQVVHQSLSQIPHQRFPRIRAYEIIATRSAQRVRDHTSSSALLPACSCEHPLLAGPQHRFFTALRTCPYGARS